MSSKDEVAIVIPSLEPDDKLLNVLQDLTERGFKNIFLINDGSSERYSEFFERAVSLYGCVLLPHYINLGKGRALKTAFNAILSGYPGIKSAVTVDSDGQHRIEDIERCYQASIENKQALIMGCRDFSKETSDIPFRSRFGNVMTCKVLKIFCGIQLTDTQTGLRGISSELMEAFMTIKGERFEYEMNMILETKELGIQIIEVPIQTIYIEENKTSHFNPLTDSLKIYAMFGKFIFSSIFSFLIDILLFSLFVSLLSGSGTYYISISAYLARGVSALFNYQVNKTKVFKGSNGGTSALVKYITLCMAQIILSAFVTEAIFAMTGFSVTGIKIAVDILLFFISFQIQRSWVFSNTIIEE